MISSTRSRIVACFVVALLFGGVVFAHAAAPQSGVYLEFEAQSGGQAYVVKLSMAPDRMRFDTDQGISMVSIGGEGGKMLMIQHAQHQYMEFTAEMMEAMAKMMGQMPPEVTEEMENMTPPTFTRTGNTKQVGEWSAYEVLVQHPDHDGNMTMWFSQDVDADFRTLAQQFADSMSSLLNSPMMRMGGGGGGPSEAFQQLQAQINAVDMPDGFPVQIITDDGGTQATTTLRAIDQGASFGADTWEPPAGYTKMDLPFIR